MRHTILTVSQRVLLRRSITTACIPNFEWIQRRKSLGRQGGYNTRRSVSNDASWASPLASSSSLGLFDTLVSPHLKSLSELPEIKAALVSDPSAVKIEGLKRAVQIFETMGGPLHTAVLALLAEAYQHTGEYKNVIEILEKLQQVESSSPSRVQLALANALCFIGDFDRALKLVIELSALPQIESSRFARGTVLCTQGTILVLQLTKDNSYQEAHEGIQILRVAAKSLESEAAAIAYNNMGVAQLASEIAFLDQIRVDPSMSSFQNALSMTDNALLKGRIYNNMASTLLLDEYDDGNMLKLASEYSREALRIYETATTLTATETRAGLGRALSLAASCYVRADSAVTAEGLFQTAIETTGVDPLTKIVQRETFRSYSELCRKWDKRHVDAERLQERSKEINETLPDAWKDKPSIVGGLVFPTL
jgi:tetratricopeptide (TPR) repeat protein